MPLRILLEEMEQADFTMVGQQGKGHSAGLARVWGSRGVGPGRPRASALGSPPEAVGRAELRCGHETHGRPVSPQLPTFIAKVLYTICFIWATSEHYNTPSRVIVTLQEFCNQLIEMVAPHCPGPPAPPAPPTHSSNTGKDVSAGTSGPGWGGPVAGYPEFSQDLGSASPPSPVLEGGESQRARLGRGLRGRLVPHRQAWAAWAGADGPGEGSSSVS